MIFTARVRSTRGGNVLTRVCVSVHTCRGNPISGLSGGYPIPGLRGYPISGLGGTPSQVQVGGYPISGLGREGTLSQVRGYPISGMGRGDTWDTPQPGLDGGGVPQCSGLGRKGVPHLRSGWGVPHLRSGGYPVPGPGRGVPYLRSGGYPISGLGREGTLSLVRGVGL